MPKINKQKLQNIPKYDIKEFTSANEAIDWLNKNKYIITKEYYEFDYPDYGGLPKKISNRLTSEAVDYIQEWTYDWNWTNEKEELKKNRRI